MVLKEGDRVQFVGHPYLGITSALPVIRPKWQLRGVQQPTRKKLICTVGFMAG
jgi:hypothetical protein